MLLTNHHWNPPEPWHSPQWPEPTRKGVAFSSNHVAIPWRWPSFRDHRRSATQWPIFPSSYYLWARGSCSKVLREDTAGRHWLQLTVTYLLVIKINTTGQKLQVLAYFCSLVTVLNFLYWVFTYLHLHHIEVFTARHKSCTFSLLR